MKKRVLFIFILFTPILFVFIYFFVNYSSLERSIYFNNLNYRFDWKLECAREATLSEQDNDEIDFYIRFKEVIHPDTSLDVLLSICCNCSRILYDNKQDYKGAKFVFVSDSQGEFIHFFTNNRGEIYKVVSQSSSDNSRFYFSYSDLQDAFPESIIEVL